MNGIREDSFDDAIICEKGHVINSRASMPEFTTKFCQECGGKAISSCSGCNQKIRGGMPGTTSLWTPSAFCGECGKPYPWTDEKIAAAREVIDELDLAAEERDKLKKSVADLMANTPKSDVAAARFKRAIAKVGGGMSDILAKVISDIASETIKKTMGL